MSFPLTMTGFDREYRPPRSIRATVEGPFTAWELLGITDGPAAEWATATVDGLIASVDAQAAAALGCTDCEDTGFYGAFDPADPDLLTGLFRRVGGDGYEELLASGEWIPSGISYGEVISMDLAEDLAAAITAGAGGLLRRYVTPLAWLPPTDVVAATPLSELLSAAATASPHGEWVNLAVVDEVDQGAVLDLVQINASGTQARRRELSAWTPDNTILANGGLPMVRLDGLQLAEIQAQVDLAILGRGGPGVSQKCHYCSDPATKSIIHAEGMAYIPCCDEHLAKGKHDAERSTPDGSPDPSNIDGIRDITAGLEALVADAPLTVSPDPRAEKLRRYWSSGRGAAKIRWGLPGDWRRCYRHLSKYMGLRAKGYCQNLHRRNNGFWTGDRRNRGILSSVTVDSPVRLPSGVILRLGDRFEVQGLETGTYSAQVVDGEALRNWPFPDLEGKTVDVLLAAGVVPEDAVAVVLRCASPEPVQTEASRPWVSDGSKVQQALLSAAPVAAEHPPFGIGAVLTPTVEEVFRAKAALPDTLLASLSAALRNDARRAHRAATEGVAILLPPAVMSLAPSSADNGPARAVVDHTGHVFHSTRVSPEESLMTSVKAGRWAREVGRKINMTETLTIADGIYTEVDPTNGGIMNTLVAGGFPVKPPGEWFENPKLTGPTAINVTDEGRVYGHIAPWGVNHIGMAGSVQTPKNPSGKYTYFRTGVVADASGTDHHVGQLTLVGGHAPIGANHAQAVRHYDDTNSAVADVVVGEDQYGIWAAGALRPNVTPEQVRAMRACPPSGDWRVINGRLELVAACHVNVQGFPIAKSFVAGGQITSLVAAGAREMFMLRAAEVGEPVLAAKVAELEKQLAVLASAGTATLDAPIETPAETTEVVAEPAVADAVIEEIVDAEIIDEEAGQPTEEELARAEKIAKARDAVADIKREQLRARVRGSAAPVVAALPPQFLAHKKGKDGKDSTEGAAKANQSKASTIKGTDSFPISDVASLKKAIQAFGRAGDKEAAKKHITSMAYKLKRPDLIPSNWKKS